MIPNYKASNYKTWKQFWRICALLKYSLEYFDYILQSDHYGGAGNIV